MPDTKKQRSVTLKNDDYDRAAVMADERNKKVATFVAELINKEWLRGEIA